MWIKIKEQSITVEEWDYNMWNIFKDNNDWNEKNVVGFIAFLVMVVFAVLDLVTGYVGKDLIINEFIYDSFTLVVLGCCGIAGLEKFAGVKK